MAEHLQIGALFDVKGRCVAVTGGASGIGLMISRGCVANSCSVILIDVNEEALSKAKLELKKIISSSSPNPAQVQTIHGDLSTEGGVQAVVENVKSKVQCLDTLIHCAAIRYMNNTVYKPGETLEQLESATLSAPYSGWEHTMRLNVLAPYFLTAGLITLLGKAAAKGEGRGSVILFSSPASVHNNQFVPCYQTSKAAVDHLVRIMAMEFANFYIRVNGMSPGIVPSGMTTSDSNSNIHLVNETPAKRAGTEEDMVSCALWLMSKAGEFMDGKIIRIEGGRLLILKGVTSNSD
ncbi:unnamed protein product [Clonostachys rosea f. rosea IK726]|uniref:Uncharacterized protein n=1 Tax=Clonostachys rosea f. rosea IK726 TaxID=1349383 RepID=A0ACA9TPJ0_BIOOC|nr:unnamed protein product [Clonostachys rosea f. rosea IK726]